MNPLSGLSHLIAEQLASVAERSGLEASEVRDFYEERASVRQYEQGMVRGEAEQAAAEDCEALA